MVIQLEPELETALRDAARRQGVAPEALALSALRQRFLDRVAAVHPRDDWERRLLGLAKDCGVSLPNWAVRREGLYE